jgi:hypothetical protein
LQIEDEEENEDEFKQLESSQAKSNSETLPARAVSDGIGVRHFEAAFLQIFAVIEHGAANE